MRNLNRFGCANGTCRGREREMRSGERRQPHPPVPLRRPAGRGRMSLAEPA